MVYVHAKPLAELMLQAQRAEQQVLPIRTAERAGLVRLSALQSMQLTAKLDRAGFDRWRAESLLAKTTAANDEASPATAPDAA